jgi:hypothetical protein
MLICLPQAMSVQRSSVCPVMSDPMATPVCMDNMVIGGLIFLQD